MKHFSLKSACGHCMSRHLKVHPAVVVKNAFWLEKPLTSLKNKILV